MKGISEREAALEALMGVVAGGYNNIVVNRVLLGAGLSREGRAFVTECVNGTLRRLITLDYIINQVSNTNTRAMDAYVLNLLRMSVYQMAFMRNTAIHAVCDEAVKMVAMSKHSALKGFVNANLRSIARLLPEILGGIDKIKASDRNVWMEIKYSCQRAVTTVLEREMGADETEAFLEHVNTYRPPVSVRVNTLKTDKDALERRLSRRADVAGGVFMENCLRLTGIADMQSLPEFRDGLFHVMDEGAMLVVKAAALAPGMRVLDVCAAPGGKAFMAACEMGDAGSIEARDIHPHKIDLIIAGTKRLGLTSISVKQADAAVFDESLADSFDVVMADVPCSGLGLIGKKPEIRYRYSINQVQKLQGLQRRILNACAKYVKPGGALIYSTCTLTVEENRKNAAWFAKTHGFTPQRFPCPVQGTAVADENGHVLLLPHKTGTDGFYIARFVRNR